MTPEFTNPRTITQSDIDILIRSIRATVLHNKKLLIPVSGGSDSSLCLWLCAKALPGRTVGVFHGDTLPTENKWLSSISEIIYDETPSTGFKDLEVYRWARFLETALIKDSVLVGSRTLTEQLLGTYSLASRLATFMPLVSIWKSEIMQMSRLIEMPQSIIDSSQRADPECGRPTELAMISYKDVDRFLSSKMINSNNIRYKTSLDVI
jgi:NH3-dependent NAD+ synthetase